MIEDIIQGTVLPPVVVGAVVGEQSFDYFKRLSEAQFVSWLIENAGDISLIDGMQRTTALIAAEKEKKDGLKDYQLRVEVWLAKSINHLIYRMLILNSGQVPWNIKRQLQTVFNSLLKKIRNEVPNITIFTQDEKRRRTAPMQYQASDILELYLVFGSRKERIDIKEKLSDEFVRLDFIDVTSSDQSSDLFCRALHLMGELDQCFGNYQSDETSTGDERFFNGKDIFFSQPARVGFITATALLMLGRPGSTKSKEILDAEWSKKEDFLKELIRKLHSFNPSQLKEFLALETLSEKLLNKKVSKVGDYEREFFKTAFYTMYEESMDLGTLEVCWNAF